MILLDPAPRDKQSNAKELSQEITLLLEEKNAQKMKDQTCLGFCPDIFRYQNLQENGDQLWPLAT